MIIQYIIKYLFLTLAITLSALGIATAQEDVEVLKYGEKLSYEIGGIQIVGAENKDRNAIKSIAALREGSKIQIPGPEIPNAIKALLRLKLFENVQIYQDSVKGEVVFLRIVLDERPILSRYSYKGVKSSQHEDLNDIVKTILTKGGIVTEDQKELARQKIRQHYISKGRLDALVSVREFPDEGKTASIRLEFEIELNEKIKIEDILFEGNTKFSSKKLRKKMSKTKRKGTLLRKSKFIEKEYEEDLNTIVKFYQQEGYKNARIVHDTMYRLPNTNVMLNITIDEGNRFYFRDIKWKGNSIYTDDQLYTILGISKGDVYNPELLQNRLKFSLDGRDISSLYLDDGYLAFDITPAEVAIVNDSVDIEMRIFEGPQFTVDNVVIKGNDRTNEHIVRREIRTRPGQRH